MNTVVSPPRSEEELLARARDIAGQSLASLGRRLARHVPDNPVQAKGWTGQLIEDLLGATARSRPEPDFQLIGVEMKTLPVAANGWPRESTYVCNVPLTDHAGMTWETSNVRAKLERVLWVPVQGERSIPLPERRLGSPLLWSPTQDEESALRTDWEELMELVCVGKLAAITAHAGSCLQIRPKAANSRARRWGVEESGAPVRTLPRGFYLRAAFTGDMLRRHYVMPG